VLFTSKGYLKGLITKKDVIRNMAALEEAAEDDDELGPENDVFEVGDGGLLDGEDEDHEPLRRSNSA
jgi:hypothetical protein